MRTGPVHRSWFGSQKGNRNSEDESRQSVMIHSQKVLNKKTRKKERYL
jgi:hypothetical protein